MVNQPPVDQGFVLLRDAINQLLDNSVIPARDAQPGGSRQPRALPLDVYATPEEAVILAALPGATPDDVEITYHERTVTLSGEAPRPAEREGHEDATWYLRELWSGAFQRSVTLPFEVDPSKAEASFAQGILRITLPKAESAKPRKVALRVASGQPAAAAESPAHQGF